MLSTMLGMGQAIVVAVPAMLVGGAAGTLVWFLTNSVALTAITTVVVIAAVGRYCYRQLK